MENGVDVVKDGFRSERGFEITRAVRDEVEAKGGREGFDEILVDIGESRVGCETFSILRIRVEREQIIDIVGCNGFVSTNELCR